MRAKQLGYHSTTEWPRAGQLRSVGARCPRTRRAVRCGMVRCRRGACLVIGASEENARLCGRPADAEYAPAVPPDVVKRLKRPRVPHLPPRPALTPGSAPGPCSGALFCCVSPDGLTDDEKWPRMMKSGRVQREQEGARGRGRLRGEVEAAAREPLRAVLAPVQPRDLEGTRRVRLVRGEGRDLSG